ncbi:hypothetical protein COCVIDRAFT_84184 [Bipolaris victoriae FI3]|uniref:Uncharacterized protein n=1 Tax=Bipolaris victoriae (strain FI3) TaxID=930091 RepID=W7F0N9_BIPV3|nr:hypothetical protein COCVIDRAFT_84184 [Bipolaris victoriae FI3]
MWRTRCEETNVKAVGFVCVCVCVCGKGVHTVLSRHEAFGLHQTVRPWACVPLQGRGKGQTRCGSPD